MVDVRVHDAFGSKDVITWAVQLFVALGAAFLGARVGGKMAHTAAVEAINVEWDTQRRHAQERMFARVESNLRRMQLLDERCSKHADVNEPLDPDVGEELEVVWNLYYRVAEPIFTIDAGDLSERLDFFFVRVHTLAERIKTFEAEWRTAMMAAHESDAYRATRGSRYSVPNERHEALSQLRRLGEEAGKLLSEVTAAKASRS